MTRLKYLTLIIGCITICACSSMPGEQGAINSYVETQKNLAQQLEDQGDLAGALAVWRTLIPLGKPDEQTSSAINSLEKRIAQNVAANITSGQRAYKRGDSRQGDYYMLRALALQPGQETAKTALAKSFSNRARAQQTSPKNSAKAIVPAEYTAPKKNPQQQLEALYSRKDYAGMLALKLSPEPGNSRTNELLRQAHIGQANKAEQKGNIDAALQHIQAAMIIKPLANDPLVDRSLALRNKLSQHWYLEGSRLMKTNISGAIEALQKSLTYNPYNNNAKRKLSQAKTLQRNLKRIEGN
jgi:tetratricopeptide (TPR) repeat protein